MVTYIVFNNINLADFGTPEADARAEKAMLEAGMELLRSIIISDRYYILRQAGFES